MKLAERFWAGVTYLMNLVTFSPIQNPNLHQAPLPGHLDVAGHYTNGAPVVSYSKGPVFKPPAGRLEGDGSNFVCDYTKMSGYTFCSTPEDRTCWLYSNGTNYTIYTDYEAMAPIGVVRNYVLYLSQMNMTNVDGMEKYNASLFNETFPGPRLEACWGDTFNITVYNDLKFNGSTIHWHGIRQNQTMQMDGVNGITQCPIAPGDSFTYTFNATQYGTSWYHSHYSLAYADGLAGPLLIHGPSSANYDEAIDPLLISDWGHQTVFYNWAGGEGAWNETTLLNGIGNVTRVNGISPTYEVPQPHTVVFQKGTRYLLRVINMAFDWGYVFSIDGHKMTVISTDFVPITPYTTRSIMVGIGQRYNVIVEADPESPTDDGLYWIRTHVCISPPGFPANNPKYIRGYDTSGILSYGARSPNDTTQPTSTAWHESVRYCADEPYESLKPIVPWKVGSPSNGHLEYPVNNTGQIFNVQVERLGERLPNFMIGPPYVYAGIPLYINFSEPTFLNLDRINPWHPDWVVIPQPYHGEEKWVWLHIVNHQNETHPIHLHGHDFALVYQSPDNSTWNATTDMASINYDNPPRRDVALLPVQGNMIIAFRADNPGAWLLHCHIAFHASMGLAMQILESREIANEMWNPKTTAYKNAQTLCDNWNTWYADKDNWYDYANDPNFQDDSGI